MHSSIYHVLHVLKGVQPGHKHCTGFRNCCVAALITILPYKVISQLHTVEWSYKTWLCPEEVGHRNGHGHMKLYSF